MKRLKTEDFGGLKFFAQHFRWHDNAIREAFTALISAYGLTGAESFVLSGCVITAAHPNYTWTEGWLCKSGVIYYVMAGSITTATVIPSGYALVWDVKTSYDPAGTINFVNGTSYDIFEIKYCALDVVSISGFPDYMPYTAPTIHQKQAAKLASIEPTFYQLTLNAPWLHGIGGLNIKKDHFNQIYIQGNIYLDNAVSSGIFATLPVGMRPPVDLRKVIVTDNTVVNILIISTTGTLSILNNCSTASINEKFKL